MSKLNYTIIENGFQFKNGRWSIKVTVSIRQEWLLTIGEFSWAFRDARDAWLFIGYMRRLAAG